MPTDINNHNGELITPERNHFFYGKLMDTAQFEKDQRYFNHKRTLINRLVLGSGVVCGLDVIPDPDAENRILIQPGFAIDGRGCEIIVVEALSINPHQLTDDQGVAVGDPIASGTVEICLAYNEVETDLVPVLVPECDRNENCAPSTFREGFHILIRQVEDDPSSPPSCRFGDVPLAESDALHALLCERVRAPCPPIPEDTRVPLARISLPFTEGSINPCLARPLVYNNRLLYELILCLARQVEALTPRLFLRIISGNNQTGSPGELLALPLVVEIIDAEANPAIDVLVQFEVTAANGNVNFPTIRTDQVGRAENRWTLGPGIGEQQVTVSAVGTASAVSFRATAD